MTRPETVDAALRRLEQHTGIRHGQHGLDIIHALRWIDQLEHHDQAVTRREQAVNGIRAAVGQLVDHTDQPDCLAGLLRDLADLLQPTPVRRAL